MAVIATAGHVDHGKSSLIRAMTGTDPDRLAEEQKRAMTIDLGFAHCTTTNGTVLSFIDVPGHADFIRTMISGVSAVDIVMLIVDANEGWKPQTEEHLGIIEVLGITQGVVVLTKCDKVDTAIVERRQSEISARLVRSAVQWTEPVITSVNADIGVTELVTRLEEMVTATRHTQGNGRPRLFIDRIFTIKGSGTVVTGTLEGDSLGIATALVVARTGQSVRIREMQSHGSLVDVAQPHSRCALNLTGIDASELQRGDALVCEADWWMTSVFDAHINVLPELQHELTHRGSFTLHVGTHSQSVTIRVLQQDNIAQGTSGLIRVRLKHPLPLAPGDHFLLRNTGIESTVGGGLILDVDPRTKTKDAQPDGSVQQILGHRGWIPVHHAEQLTGKKLEPVIGQWFATEDIIQATFAQLEQRLDTEDVVDTAELSQVEREIIATLREVAVHNGLAVRGNNDPLLDHPYVQLFRSAGVITPDAAGLDRNIIRQLVQKKILFEHDNIIFHADTLESLRPALTRLWENFPTGFSMAQLRDALQVTRKHALPLATCLDKVGLTKRRDDVRIPGAQW